MDLEMAWNEISTLQSDVKGEANKLQQMKIFS
jgi:hypothetical protein